MQNHYNLVYREEEREMFPTLKVIQLLPLYVQLTVHLVFWYRCDSMVPARSWTAYATSRC